MGVVVVARRSLEGSSYAVRELHHPHRKDYDKYAAAAAIQPRTGPEKFALSFGLASKDTNE